MALTCTSCGSYSREVRGREGLQCRTCGHPSAVAPRPILVVTGAAASGKSTICAGLAGVPGLLALDGDVLAGGAAAVADGRKDYAGFWRFLLDLGREIHLNGLAPVYCCISLPSQVLEGADLARFTAVHFLALRCDEDDLSSRILTRRGGEASAANLDFHLDFNRRLPQVVVPAPHTLTALNTSGVTVHETVDLAARWARTLASPSARPEA